MHQLEVVVDLFELKSTQLSRRASAAANAAAADTAAADTATASAM